MRRRNKLRACVHFVWSTKNRLPLVSEDIERDVYRCIRAICDELKCGYLEANGMPDHVHLFVAMPSTVTFAKVMQRVKGGTSHLISDKLKPGDWFAWQPNYAATAVSPSDKERVIRYIRNQKEHHANGTLWPEAEETDEESPEDDTT